MFGVCGNYHFSESWNPFSVSSEEQFYLSHQKPEFLNIPNPSPSPSPQNKNQSLIEQNRYNFNKNIDTISNKKEIKANEEGVNNNYFMSIPNNIVIYNNKDIVNDNSQPVQPNSMSHSQNNFNTLHPKNPSNVQNMSNMNPAQSEGNLNNTQRKDNMLTNNNNIIGNRNKEIVSLKHNTNSINNHNRRPSYLEQQVKKLKLLDTGKLIKPQQKLISQTNKESREMNMNMDLNETVAELSLVINVENYFKKNSDVHMYSRENSVIARGSNPINSEKQMQQIHEVANELNKLGDINFNVFNLHENSEGIELLLVMLHLWRIHNFENKLSLNSESYSNYFYIVNSKYRKNPYHNSIHATDVTQTFFFLMKTCNIELNCNLSDLEIFSCLFACAVHDLDHPGNTNLFEINTNSNIALSYNDRSVLENYHLFMTFLIMEKSNCNLFAQLPKSTYNRIRSLVINCVLGTDMEFHGPDLAELKKRAQKSDFDPSTDKEKDFVLAVVVHAVDISNPTKPFHIYNNWADRILEEFFAQGDKEKALGLPVSFLCDRYTVKKPDSQIAFIRFVVSPLFEALSLVFPNMQMVVNLIKENEKKYLELKDKDNEKEKEKEKEKEREIEKN
eukprot:CAMPEP_0170521470 /NCGR_PEP_ID=MMETSP0209-20121228/6824_1 /TAXON_ID=665100 ORGANISM="Litonotus pictus, Strain P1" /NCGR_SAMPLE_ID=MMETSP0209 /ASSEMBLY_ACC=CAM_ASM_000301 /LENGTH=615 /DNA_ID=CAMNT_0010808351 /DNA_START=429 /DNA_END=2276 /DNA_ORIENTATION=+